MLLALLYLRRGVRERWLPQCRAVHNLTPGQEAPVGTLVVTWEAIAAKTDGGQSWGTPISEYGWYSTDPDYSNATWLLFSLKRAFVVGENETKAYLKLTPQCDRYTTDYNSTQALYDSCNGTATFPKDFEMTGFWAIFEGPLQIFQMQKPFEYMEFSTQLSSTLSEPQNATYIGQDFDFALAESSPGSKAPNVTRVGVIDSARLGPFLGTGKFSFERLTLKVAYTEASAKKGDTLSWAIPATAGQIDASANVTTEYEFNLDNPCEGNPCGDGGNCSVVESYNYQCACLPGFKSEASGTSCIPE